MKNLFKSAFTMLFISIYVSSSAQLNWLIENDKPGNELIKLGNKDTGGKYLLKNSTVEFTSEKYREVLSGILKGVDRSGVNLGWGTMTEKFNGSNFVNIQRKAGYTGALKTGEPIAIRFEGQGYLMYESQTYGINLGFAGSNTVVTKIPFEFSFYDETGEKGKEVKTNKLYALCHKEKDFIVYCSRDYGVNLGWWSDCKSGELGVLTELKNKISIVKNGYEEVKWVLEVVKRK
jgi:hypothetical protein